MFRESHARSVLKAVSWRIFGTAVTSALVYVFTRRLALSLTVGGVEFLSIRPAKAQRGRGADKRKRGSTARTKA